MATSEPRLTIKKSLTPSELDDVGALVREARWNQLAADWRLFVEFGRLYAIHSAEGRVVARPRRRYSPATSTMLIQAKRPP